jgi:hypothetical protein
MFDTTRFAELRKRLARVRGSPGKLLDHLKTIQI